MDPRNTKTDTAVLAELAGRLAQHRLQRNLTQAELAREAGVSKRTLIRLESGESTQLTNLVRVLRALDLLHKLDAFVPTPTLSPIEQLRLQRKERKRASPRTGRPASNEEWKWGDENGTPGGES